MRISDWSSDVCSSDLPHALLEGGAAQVERQIETEGRRLDEADDLRHPLLELGLAADKLCLGEAVLERAHQRFRLVAQRSEEHTSELQSLMRISYAVFCLKKKTKTHVK